MHTKLFSLRDPGIFYRKFKEADDQVCHRAFEGYGEFDRLVEGAELEEVEHQFALNKPPLSTEGFIKSS
jgi:hypothetical protein